MFTKICYKITQQINNKSIKKTVLGVPLRVGLSLLAFFSCEKQLKKAQTRRSIPNAFELIIKVDQNKMQARFKIFLILPLTFNL